MMQFNIHHDVHLYIVCSVSRITSKFVRVHCYVYSAYLSTCL